MHNTEDEAPWQEKNIIRNVHCFPGASFLVVLSMVAQTEYRKWAIKVVCQRTKLNITETVSIYH